LPGPTAGPGRLPEYQHPEAGRQAVGVRGHSLRKAPAPRHDALRRPPPDARAQLLRRHDGGTGEADACITGLTKDYGKSIIPSLQVVGTEEGVRRVASMYIIQHKKGPYFFADTTVNINPTAEKWWRLSG
jgi:hypothetical protein